MTQTKSRYDKTKSTHAIPAVCNVDMNPQISADVATRTIVLACEGASAPSTPIWIPSELRLAKPHREYEAMLKAR